MEIYSYYWLRPDETVIIGWDNAPHHESAITFPHHKHVPPDIKRHRIPAPDLSFTPPNLPKLIYEIENL